MDHGDLRENARWVEEEEEGQKETDADWTHQRDVKGEIGTAEEEKARIMKKDLGKE